MILRVAVVTESFPKISETFVLQHIKVLIDSGADVRVFSFIQNSKDKIHPLYNEYDMDKLVQYKPVLPSNLAHRYVKGFYLFCRGMLINPSAIFKSINFFKRGKRAAKLIDLFELSTFLTHDQFDIIHCHFGTMANHFLRFQKMGALKGKIITSFHGYDADGPQLMQETDYYRELKENGDVFLVNSEYTRSKLLQMGFLEKKIRKLPVAVDTDKFLPIRRPMCYKFTILSVARLIEVKGLEFSIRAMSQLIKMGFTDFQFKIIGDGPLKEKLIDLAEKEGLLSFISFMGFRSQEEVIAELVKADLFLMSSIKTREGREEAQGLSLLEAQAMEIPVIGTNVGGVSDSIIDGVTGFLVPEKNEGAIAEKILWVVNNKDRAIEMGRAGRKFVQENFCIESFSKSLFKIYESLSEN